MTPQRLGLLIAEGATAAGRNLATDLRALGKLKPHEVFSRAASLAEAGRLREALVALGAPDTLARAAGQWPGVLQPARLSAERLPTTRRLVFGLSVLGTFCLLLVFVQLFVGAILALKVMPALAPIRSAAPDPRDALFTLIPIQVVVWACALAAVRWARAPWNRDLALASHAIVGAALVESKAPADVVTAWLASEPSLAGSAGQALGEDLRSLAAAFAARAEASMHRFLAGFRFVALGLVVVEAAWMVRDVLVTVSTLAGAVL